MPNIDRDREPSESRMTLRERQFPGMARKVYQKFTEFYRFEKKVRSNLPILDNFKSLFIGNVTDGGGEFDLTGGLLDLRPEFLRETEESRCWDGVVFSFGEFLFDLMQVSSDLFPALLP